MLCAPLPAHAADLTRQVTINGIDSQDLRKELRALSILTDSSRRYTSLAAIRRMANEDAGRMIEALSSKGYYAATISPKVVRSDDTAVVTFDIDRGPKFVIAQYRITYTDEIADKRPQSFADAGVKTANDPTGDALVRLETQLVGWLQSNGFPLARAQRHFVEANFDTGRATAVFEVRSGALARFGAPVIQNEDHRTRDKFIAAYKTWEEGELYDRDKVVEYREQLAQTGLFQQITIDPVPPTLDGEADILVDVTERKHRTLGAGVSYATDIGPGFSLFWENRNSFRHGERLSAELEVSDPEQLLGLTLTRPLPTLPGRLESSIVAKNEVTDAYDAASLELASSLSKTWFRRKLTLAGGVSLNYAEVEDALITDEGQPATEAFSYIKFPVSLNWNSDNDVLNPTAGFRAGGSITPYTGDISFVRATLSGATRHQFGKDGKFVIAGRANIGSSYGTNTFDIPATERFYAGGGGSVRGYAYQEAGPLDEAGVPIGGSSIIEVNTELRYAVRNKLQAAFFVDGGSVYDNEYPDFSEDLLWGAGFGIRYLTPVGPLRADIATPLTPRDSDDSIQFYIALGQPF